MAASGSQLMQMMQILEGEVFARRTDRNQRQLQKETRFHVASQYGLPAQFGQQLNAAISSPVL